jgi:hypothetical protein
MLQMLVIFLIFWVKSELTVLLFLWKNQHIPKKSKNKTKPKKRNIFKLIIEKYESVSTKDYILVRCFIQNYVCYIAQISYNSLKT